MGSDDRNGLRLRMSLSVLEHLGLHLYSNVPAVLSEAVANAWDADAKRVDINIHRDDMTIEIVDDGVGMSFEDVNERFLLVGYRRREAGEDKTPSGREVMGRKGIGKLSLFSIADRFEVRTIKSNHAPVAFELDARKIREHYRGAEGQNGEGTKREKRAWNEGGTTKPYRPLMLEPDVRKLEHGTRIVLTDIRRQRLAQTATHLRQRLARRFSVIGPRHDFQVFVDGKEVRVSDRGYLEKLEYVWWYETDPADLVSDTHEFAASFERPNAVSVEMEGRQHNFSISGWLGTVDKPRQLKEDGQSLNRITVLVRGKAAQEDVLDTIDDAGIYTKYLVGEIQADFLDLDEHADIATSSRQALVEDDPRFQSLLSVLRRELAHIESRWSELRKAKGTKKALEIPAIREWFEELDTRQRKMAEQLFGKINQLTVDDERDRRRLFTASVLAFENLEHRQLLDKLEGTPAEDVHALIKAMSSLDDLEASMYYQIVRQRLETIDRLEELVDANALESAIQELLFDHLWLLDPAWERATDASTHFAERTVTRAFEEFDTKLTNDERKGRIDIAWKTYSGGHIIVELKRPNRRLSTEDISAQVRKYQSALRKVLRDAEGIEHPDVQAVVIVGRDLADWDRDGGRVESKRILSQSRSIVEKYDKILTKAQNVYAEFVEQRTQHGRIVRLLERIENEDLPGGSNESAN